jgi:hypothetical protein
MVTNHVANGPAFGVQFRKLGARREHGKTSIVPRETKSDLPLRLTACHLDRASSVSLDQAFHSLAECLQQSSRTARTATPGRHRPDRLRARAMYLTVAEYACANPDGTFTVVRGGIDNWKTKSIPFDLAAWLLIDADGAKQKPGLVPIRVSVRDASGVSIFELLGQAEIAKAEGHVRAAINFGGKISSTGPLIVEATLGLETDQQVVNVVLDSGS